jgi:hypothetical protein
MRVHRAGGARVTSGRAQRARATRHAAVDANFWRSASTSPRRGCAVNASSQPVTGTCAAVAARITSRERERRVERLLQARRCTQAGRAPRSTTRAAPPPAAPARWRRGARPPAWTRSCDAATRTHTHTARPEVTRAHQRVRTAGWQGTHSAQPQQRMNSSRAALAGSAFSALSAMVGSAGQRKRGRGRACVGGVGPRPAGSLVRAHALGWQGNGRGWAA